MTVWVLQWGKTGNQPIELAVNKIIPVRGMKAILLKANGDELQLGEYNFQIEGDNGAVFEADSCGLLYEVTG